MKNKLVSPVEGTLARDFLEPLEEEFAKDKWDARRIPGLRYAPAENQHYINFQHVPSVFRLVVKDFIKSKLATGVAATTLYKCAYCVGNFLVFFLGRYPQAHTLRTLTKQDIDDFVLFLHAEAQTHGLKRNDQRTSNHLSYTEEFLHYLERIQSPMRPNESASCIIWPSHYPRFMYRYETHEKYIPQMVLSQLDTHLQHLSSTCIPIVIVLRASGWRISDVLYLKLDTCLGQEADKCWLVGDIQKTRVLGHRIPITTEVAAVVRTQMEWIRQHYTREENPKGWLFPASKRIANTQRFLHGDSFCAASVRRALNRLARMYQIKDEQGKLFNFKSHAFRHTKALR